MLNMYNAYPDIILNFLFIFAIALAIAVLLGWIIINEFQNWTHLDDFLKRSIVSDMWNGFVVTLVFLVITLFLIGYMLNNDLHWIIIGISILVGTALFAGFNMIAKNFWENMHKALEYNSMAQFTGTIIKIEFFKPEMSTSVAIAIQEGREERQFRCDYIDHQLDKKYLAIGSRIRVYYVSNDPDGFIRKVIPVSSAE